MTDQGSPAIDEIRVENASLRERNEQLLRRAADAEQALVAFARARKTAEEALRVSHDLLEEAQATARVGSWTSVTGPGDELHWSRECYRIFDIPEGTPMTVESFFARVHPADREEVRRASLRALEDGAAYDIEHRVQRTDGALCWVRERARVDRDVEGRPVRMLGTVQDITEGRRVLDQLSLSDERYRRILENTSEGVWLSDGNYETTFVNQRMADMLGYACDEIVGRPVFLFLTDEGAEQAKVKFARRAAGLSETYQNSYKKKDGTTLWALAKTNPIFDPAGAFAGSVGLLTDMTQRRASEEARTRLEAALRDKEEQFRQAQKMEAVGRLAGGVAHDFNNLLSVILSYAEMAIEELVAGDPMRDDLEEIQTAGRQATELTQQLLAFSRQQVLKPRVIEIGEVVLGLERMLGRLLGEDVELTLLAAEGAGRVLADPGQIEQVVMNLAVNARDAMPDGGKITIEMANVELDADASARMGVQPGHYVVLAITDTGCGMDAATATRAFDPFFTTKAKGKGTGLGLATVFGIVQQSGGHISVNSQPGMGSTFKVHLPRTDRPAEEPSASGTPRVLLGSETILLVEDAAQVRTVATLILRRHGYHVLETANGGEASLVSKEYPSNIDLLLTDVVMPRMSGRKLAEELRTQRPGMRVLFASGYTDDAIAHHGVLEAGGAFLQKPFTPHALLRKVREALDAPRPLGQTSP